MQLAYAQYGDKALKGMLYDLTRPETESLAAEAAVGISRPVKRGTDPEKQCLNADTGASAIGFAMLHAAFEQALGTGVVEYAAKETVTVVRKGRMWVETTDAVVAGAVANLTVATGKLTDAAVAAGIEAFTQMRVRFLTSTSGAGLAAVEISPI